MGGYDTHSNTITNQTNLFNQLSPAMKAFYDYTVAAGIANNVTQFTMSDFNRTFIGNGNAGVDHAWGGHSLVLGGAVKGGDMYGTFPDLIGKGPEIRAATGRGFRRPRSTRSAPRSASGSACRPPTSPRCSRTSKNFAPDLGFMS